MPFPKIIVTVWSIGGRSTSTSNTSPNTTPEFTSTEFNISPRWESSLSS